MILEILSGTPWWVYLLLALLLWIGITRLKPQVISLKQLFVMPLGLTIWSLGSLLDKFNALADVSLWAVFAAFGALLGWFIVRSFSIKADKKRGLIELPGSPLTLILIMLIFGTKYFFGAFYSINPQAYKYPLIFVADLASSGWITGSFIGQTLCYWRKFSLASHADLMEN
jgi:hypothetical protein